MLGGEDEKGSWSADVEEGQERRLKRRSVYIPREDKIRKPQLPRAYPPWRWPPADVDN